MENIEGKYFIDEDKYNCPFCKNRGIKYVILGIAKFNEKIDKEIYAVFVECSQCHNISMHLVKRDSYINFAYNSSMGKVDYNFLILSDCGKDYKTYAKCNSNSISPDELKLYKIEDNYIPLCKDEDMILHIPTSFFTIDERIPKKFRELIEEAEKCIQNNCLTGASACIRKTIYEFLLHEKVVGDNYEDKIKSLKGKHPTLDNDYIDMISGIQGIMCDQVHEATVHENFKTSEAKAYIEILKEIFNHFYVLPKEASERKSKINNLAGHIRKQKQT